MADAPPSVFDKFKNRCFKCGGANHSTSNCPLSAKTNPTSGEQKRLTDTAKEIKRIRKRRQDYVNDKKRVGRELRVLKALRQGCVIRLYEVVETPSRIFVIMEYADGGSLLDYVRGRKRLDEKEACRMFQQTVSALEYCHSADVIHRDVKLENILLDGQGNAKLIDFGLAAIAPPNKKLRVHCGSPSYALLP